MDNYYNSSEFKEILSRYEDAKKKNVGIYIDCDDLVDIAEYYYDKGDLTSAEEVTNYAIEMFPGSALPLSFKARLELLAHGNSQRAEEVLKAVDDKNNVEYHYIKAEILINKNEKEEADNYLENAYQHIDPNDKPDFLLDVASMFADYDAVDISEKWLKRSNETDLLDYQEILGRILLSKGKYKESEKVFNHLLDKNPYSNTYWNILASVQFMANDISSSIKSSEFSLAIDPNNQEALLNKANGLYNLGNFKDALTYYRKYVQQCPKDEVGETFLGITLLNLDNLEEAVKHLKKAETLAKAQDGNLLDIYQELAFTLSRLGKFEEAINYVDKTKDLDCDHDEMNVLKGHILLENDHMEEANVCFNKAIEHSKSAPYIILRIAISLYDNNIIPLAYRLLRNMYDNNKDTTFYEGYPYLAKCCHDLGYMKEFEKYKKLALKLAPQQAGLILGNLAK